MLQLAIPLAMTVSDTNLLGTNDHELFTSAYFLNI